ncbi:L-aspartate oxidase [candidate division KSB1 bacterium]|nr:L-aspartate oxidase [candidate division KSB1 bacterium]
MIHESDFLIIGSGIAGLTCALKLAAFGRVTIITKKARAESNTNYAQGGIAVVASTEDSFKSHIRDTLRTGVDLSHPEAVELMVQAGPERLKELIASGVQFSQTNTASLELGREGGHSFNRIVHAKDSTGAEIEKALLAALKSNPAIEIFENFMAIELITEHHLGIALPTDSGPRNCWGIYAVHEERREIHRFLARITVLATGGCGQVYLHTTNPLIATGDGVAMAFRAGAEIANMEFIQFHPTTLFHPDGQSFLITEAVRGFGAWLRLKSGARFMPKYHAMAELAPRDIVAQAIDAELKKHGDECVYLDLTHLDAGQIKARFPGIYQNCLNFKIDITRDLIPVVPAAHYMCGGVVTNLNGQTSIRGLYACGEVAHTGVHGANRLASNSLLEAVVFSHQVVQHAYHYLATCHKPPQIPAWDDRGTFNYEEWVLVAHDKFEIQQLMWDYVGIVRSQLRLKRAQRRINLISREIEHFYKRAKITGGMLELRNLACVARLIIDCALRRRESRGLHYRTDFPTLNHRTWRRDQFVRLALNRRISLTKSPKINW